MRLYKMHHHAQRACMLNTIASTEMQVYVWGDLASFSQTGGVQTIESCASVHERQRVCAGFVSLMCSVPSLYLAKLDICGWTDVLFRSNSVEPIISSGYSGDFSLSPCVPPVLKRVNQQEQNLPIYSQQIQSKCSPQRPAPFQCRARHAPQFACR